MIGMVKGTTRQMKQVAGLPAPIASFRTNMSGNINSLKVLVEAQQDLHGYDKPWAGGAGKNELAMSVSNIKSLNTTGTWNGNEYTLNGVSFTIITDNAGNVTGIKVNGTATNETNFDIAEYSLKAGTSKKINGTSTQPSDTTVAYGFRGYGNVSANVDRTMTRASDAGDWNNYVYIKVYTGYNANNLMYYPMIRDASISDGTFAPYSNICPITGWSGANVTVNDGQTPPIIENVYTIAFGDTYYGGELDVTNGVLRVTHGFKTFTGDISEAWTNILNGFNIIIPDAKQIQIPKANWLKGLTSQSITNLQSGECAFASAGALNFNCKYDQTADLTAWKTYLASNNLQVYYELATPFTVQLSPQQIEQLLGDNNVFADCGDVEEVKYLNRIDTVLFSKG